MYPFKALLDVLDLVYQHVMSCCAVITDSHTTSVRSVGQTRMVPTSWCPALILCWPVFLPLSRQPPAVVGPSFSVVRASAYPASSAAMVDGTAAMARTKTAAPVSETENPVYHAHYASQVVYGHTWQSLVWSHLTKFGMGTLDKIWYGHKFAKVWFGHNWQSFVWSHVTKFCTVTLDQVKFGMVTLDKVLYGHKFAKDWYGHNWQSFVWSHVTKFCMVTLDQVWYGHTWQSLVWWHLTWRHD